MDQSSAKGPCRARTKQGTPCRSFAPPGRVFCFGHDPERQGEVRAARGKGGQLKAIRGRRARLDTTAALATFTSGLIHDLIDGKKSPDVVRAAVYALSLQRQLVDRTPIEDRLAQLEQRLDANAHLEARITSLRERLSGSSR